MNALGLSYNMRNLNNKSILVEKFNTIKPDIIEIAMSRVEIQFKNETDWKCYKFILLKQIELSKWLL